jgi:hypothetical protein
MFGIHKVGGAPSIIAPLSRRDRLSVRECVSETVREDESETERQREREGASARGRESRGQGFPRLAFTCIYYIPMDLNNVDV